VCSPPPILSDDPPKPDYNNGTHAKDSYRHCTGAYYCYASFELNCVHVDPTTEHKDRVLLEDKSDDAIPQDLLS
jgi:hypothetical protein